MNFLAIRIVNLYFSLLRWIFLFLILSDNRTLFNLHMKMLPSIRLHHEYDDFYMTNIFLLEETGFMFR